MRIIKDFKTFWKDYFELWSQSCKWLRKHWLGYIILVIVVTVISMWACAGCPLPTKKSDKVDMTKDDN